MKIRHLASHHFVLCAVLLAAPVSRIHAQVSPNDDAFRADRSGVYKALLLHYAEDRKTSLNVSNETFPLENLDEACGKDFVMPQHNEAPYKLTNADLPDARFVLVDPAVQKKVVEKNDPSNQLRQAAADRKPRSKAEIDAAVKQAFDSGYFYVSEIAFDEAHLHAYAKYGFHCGELCGNGATVLLTKDHGTWKVTDTCHLFISLSRCYHITR